MTSSIQLSVTEMTDHWDIRFLSLARHISTWSKDPSTKCGAVIVDCFNRIVSLGFNGFPRGIPDDPELYANRPEKYKRVVHCEMNAMLFARGAVADCTLYTWPFMSCIQCVPVVIQSGIKRCVAPLLHHDDPLYQRWNVTDAKDLMEMGGISIDLIDKGLIP